jgi:hypothetical protein
MRLMIPVLSVLFIFAAGLKSEAASVSKQQREAIIFITNLSQGNNLERSFYDVVEFAAGALGQASLLPNYQKVTTIQGSGATLAALRNALKTAANKSTIRAVDLIFVTHGLSGEVLFADGRKTMDQVKAAIIDNLTAAQRGKLRMIFSTACFGSSHRTKWRDSGFRTASGSQGIYADSALSYPAFLGSWVIGTNFSTAVGVANAADPFRVSDNAAKAWFNSKGRQDLANQVNSNRVISGTGSLTINTMP